MTPDYKLWVLYYLLGGLLCVFTMTMIGRRNGSPVNEWYSDEWLDMAKLFAVWPFALAMGAFIGLLLLLEAVSEAKFWKSVGRGLSRIKVAICAVLFFELKKPRKKVVDENPFGPNGVGMKLSHKLLTKILKGVEPPATSVIVHMIPVIFDAEMVIRDVKKALDGGGFETIGEIFQEEATDVTGIPEALRLASQYVRLELLTKEA